MIPNPNSKKSRCPECRMHLLVNWMLVVLLICSSVGIVTLLTNYENTLSRLDKNLAPIEKNSEGR